MSFLSIHEKCYFWHIKLGEVEDRRAWDKIYNWPLKVRKQTLMLIMLFYEIFGRWYIWFHEITSRTELACGIRVQANLIILFQILYLSYFLLCHYQLRITPVRLPLRISQRLFFKRNYFTKTCQNNCTIINLELSNLMNYNPESINFKF